MEETKLIVEKATQNSLVIIDELGRGTSTSEGKIIAKTILDYLSNKIKCRCLFTTHYHDLISWCQKQERVALYFMDCQVNDDIKSIKFLYKFKPGYCPKSYGIHVAKLAGVPDKVLQRASEISNEYREKKTINHI